MTIDAPPSHAGSPSARLLNGNEKRPTRALGAPAGGLACKQWLACRAITPLRLLGPVATDSFGIITYHRVAPQCGSDPRLLNVSPDRFARQMQQLLALGYVPWPLRNVLTYHQQRRPIPRRVFIVVFDDGYANVYHHAYPVLRRLGIPATIFLATAYLDQDGPFPFDESARNTIGNKSPDDYRPLTTEQCREMYDDGLVDLGSHTHTHVDFRGHDELFRADLSRSLDVLRQSFGIERPTFSFPFGFTSPALIEIARQQGLACGVTTEVDLVRPGDDPLQWSRLGATQLDSGLTLAAKLDGWYTALRKGWRRLLRPKGGLRATGVGSRFGMFKL